MSNDDIVWYRWIELPPERRRTDIIRLPHIRLQLASWQCGVPYLTSAVPVLMGDGKKPYIILSAGPVYRSIDPDRQGKLIVGKRTEEEKSSTIPVEYLYSGNALHMPWTSTAHKEMVKDTLAIGAFNSPIWCRKARSRKDLTPRDNIATREELGLTPTEDISPRKFKAIWDGMADNAGCIGYCSDGFLWEAGMIKRGGVVCVPRQYDSEFNISGVCLKSDIKHIIKTQKWRNIKV